MELSLYQQDSLEKRVLLDFGDYIFTNAEINENLVWEQRTNPEGDLILGSANASQLTFGLNNLSQWIPDAAITGREFTYRAGALTATQSHRKTYKFIRKDVVCLSGGLAYAGHQRAPFLTIWDVEKQTMLDLPDQPPQGVQSLFVVNGKLYCGHADSPYLTAYTIQGNTLRKLANPTLSAFATRQIQDMNQRKAVFSMQGNILREYEQVRIDGLVEDLIEKTFEFQQLGVFLAAKPDRQNDTMLTVTAYDRMVKADVIIDTWRKDLPRSITLGNMLKSLCSYLGIPLATSTFLHANYVAPEPYEGENITGRQVIQWIAELAACFADIDSQGRLQLRWYQPKNYTIDEGMYTQISAASYDTKPIVKLHLRNSDEDLGVMMPKEEPGTNLYLIENNPLLHAKTDDEMKPVARDLFNVLKTFSYRPYSMQTVWGNPMIRAGDIVTVRTREGQTFPAVIMYQKITGVCALQSELSATGNQEREVQSQGLSQSIQWAWRGISLRAQKDHLISEINVCPEKVLIKAAKLEIEGVLSVNGETIIDGKYITTGRIQGKSGEFYLDLDTGDTKISYLTDQNGKNDTVVLEAASKSYGLHFYDSANRDEGNISVTGSGSSRGLEIDANHVYVKDIGFSSAGINCEGAEIHNCGYLDCGDLDCKTLNVVNNIDMGGSLKSSHGHCEILGVDNQFGHPNYYCQGTASSGFAIHHSGSTTNFGSNSIKLDSDTNVSGDLKVTGDLRVSGSSNIECDCSSSKKMVTRSLEVESDPRHKTDIQDVTFSALEKVKGLKFHSYRFLEEKTPASVETVASEDTAPQSQTAQAAAPKKSRAKARQATPSTQAAEGATTAPAPADAEDVAAKEPERVPSQQVEPIGLLWDEAPEEIRRENESGRRTIDLYGYISLVAKAQQEMQARMETLERRLAELEKGGENPCDLP